MFVQFVQRKSIQELIRFVLVGGFATLVDLVVSIVLLYSFNLHENVVTTLAFFCAFIFSFLGHRFITFKKKGSPIKFFALSFTMLLLRNAIVYLMVSYVIGGIVAIVFSMAVVTVITFTVSKFAIFKD